MFFVTKSAYKNPVSSRSLQYMVNKDKYIVVQVNFFMSELML